MPLKKKRPLLGGQNNGPYLTRGAMRLTIGTGLPG